MKKAKIAAIAAAAVMTVTAVGGLAGCGGGGAHEINVYLLANASETKFYRAYFERMEGILQEEGLDYTIKFNGEQEANYYTGLNGLMQNGNIPDIFYVRPNEILKYKNHIVSLQDFADKNAAKQNIDFSDIQDSALNMYRFDPETGTLGNPEDDLYAFPKDLSTQQLGYNKTFLEQYAEQLENQGFTMPWNMNFAEKTYTWTEYKNMCEALSKLLPSGNYACDIPSVEVLTLSYGGELIDLDGGRANGTVSDLTSGPVHQAIEYQAELVSCGAANYGGATYANFAAGKVGFYGLCGSWEVGDYDSLFGGASGWGVMPWPTVDGDTEWKGLITSAGYVVSKKCAKGEKGEVAMRIAMSFMESYAQDQLVRVQKLSLPLRKSAVEDFLSESKDSVYSPTTRKYYIDVVSGKNGVAPAKYATYDSVWLDDLDTALAVMWDKKAGALDYFNSNNWASVQSTMQAHYNSTKNN